MPEANRLMRGAEARRLHQGGSRACSEVDHGVPATSRVVGVLEYGEFAGLHCLATELVEAGTLSKLIPRHRRVPAPVAAELVGQLLEGLSHAHAQGVVHRDLKPQNLLMTRAGVLKIADFGIARVADDTNLTQTGLVTGTPRYMSPEQITGGTVDARSDLFSAGVIFYELLSGTSPLGDGSAEVGFARLLARQLTPLLEANPLIPAAVVSVVEQLMGFTPEERLQNAAAALALLGPIRKRNKPGLVRDYLEHTEHLQGDLDRMEAETLLRRARTGMSAQPPELEAVALASHFALQLDPANAEAKRLISELKGKLHVRFEPSENPKVRELEKRLESQPQDSQILAQLTQLYRSEGNLLRAALIQRRYVSLRPDDAYGRSQLARLAGEEWLPTKSPAAKTPSKPTAIRPVVPRPAEQGAAPPVVVYEAGPGSLRVPPIAKWAALALGIVLVLVGVRTAIRRLEHSEEQRFKAMDAEAERMGRLAAEAELRKVGLSLDKLDKLDQGLEDAGSVE